MRRGGQPTAPPDPPAVCNARAESILLLYVHTVHCMYTLYTACTLDYTLESTVLSLTCTLVRCHKDPMTRCCCCTCNMQVHEILANGRGWVGWLLAASNSWSVGLRRVRKKKNSAPWGGRQGGGCCCLRRNRTALCTATLRSASRPCAPNPLSLPHLSSPAAPNRRARWKAMKRHERRQGRVVRERETTK